MKYFCKELNCDYESKELMFKAIIDNKTLIMTLRKGAFKKADNFSGLINDDTAVKGLVTKGNEAVEGNATELKTRLAINTTNLLDSHGDVHIPGLWKRSLKNSDTRLHLQEHKREFNKVISDNAKAYTKLMPWKDLGVDYDGITEVLVFDSLVTKDRNKQMFKQYKNGWVKNHSVGMQYVEYVMCINSGEQWCKEEKENWDKYYPMIVNKDAADATGFFFAVIEAKVIEGSAVLAGSNFVTPTLENNMKTEIDSPSQSIENQPLNGTDKSNQFNYNPNLI